MQTTPAFYGILSPYSIKTKKKQIIERQKKKRGKEMRKELIDLNAEILSAASAAGKKSEKVLLATCLIFATPPSASV